MEDFKQDWVEVELGEVAKSIQYGYTESSSNKPIGPKFLRITDIQDNNVDWPNVPYCKISDEKLGTYLLKKGDLLFARTGATVGKSFLIRNEIPKSVFASYLIRVSVNNIVLDECLLSYYFYSPFYWQQITEGQVGIGQPNVNGTKLGKLKIPIAPLPIQRAIVLKIENLFASLDKGIADLEKAQQQLKVYRQAVLKKAFEGKLSLNDEKVLNYDLSDAHENYDFKDEKNHSHQKIISNHSSDNLPKGWKWVKLAEVCEYISDGDHQAPPKSDVGIPFITISNIDKSNNRIDFSDTFFVLNEYFQNLKDNRKPKKGDILYTVTGSFGIPVLIDFDKLFCFQRHIGLIRPKTEINQRWLYYLLQTKHVYNQANEKATGTAQKTVALSTLRNIDILFCPKSEQTAIVREIESRLSVCDKVEQSITESLEKAKALRQSILKKAFEGKLLIEAEIAQCKQEKDYEPASVLLERIKKEKKK